MNNLPQKILKTIQSKDIKPKAKWKFVIKNILVWTASIISLILSSLAVSIVIYLVKNSDWDLYPRLAGGLLRFIMMALPYFWLGFLVIFILLMYYNFKHTKKGYKYKLGIIILVSILGSLFIGILFYNIGVAEAVEDSLFQKIPVYRKFLNPKARMWTNPPKGFLGGQIISIDADDEIRVMDFKKREWQVIDGEIFKQQREMLVPGKYIKVLGEPLEDNQFKAREIYPWGKSEARKIFMK